MTAVNERLKEPDTNLRTESLSRFTFKT